MLITFKTEVDYKFLSANETDAQKNLFTGWINALDNPAKVNILFYLIVFQIILFSIFIIINFILQLLIYIKEQGGLEERSDWRIHSSLEEARLSLL